MSLNQKYIEENFSKQEDYRDINPLNGDVYIAKPVNLAEAESTVPDFFEDYRSVWNFLQNNYGPLFAKGGKLPVPAVFLCNEADLIAVADDISIEDTKQEEKYHRVVNYNPSNNCIYFSIEFLNNLKDEDALLERRIIIAEELLHALTASNDRVGFTSLGQTISSEGFVRPGFYRWVKTDEKTEYDQNYQQKINDLKTDGSIFATENLTKFLAHTLFTPSRKMGLARSSSINTDVDTLLIDLQQINQFFKKLKEPSNMKGDLDTRLIKLLVKGDVSMITDTIFTPLLELNPSEMNKMIYNPENTRIALAIISKAIVNEEIIFVPY
jgi:hypothetical protein